MVRRKASGCRKTTHYYLLQKLSKKRASIREIEAAIGKQKKPPGRPYRQLTGKELEEKRSKGLCFVCDEKYTPGHQCKGKQLFKLDVYAEEVSTDEDGEDEKIKDEPEPVEEDLLAPVISMKALTGIPSLLEYKMMRVSGAVNGHKIHILVDSGSTHNFIDTFTVKKLNCQVSSSPTMTVVVANGNIIQCNQVCAGLTWKMQGQQFQADLLVLPLEGCQMVLGIQWLIQLGPILWDFQQLRMDFIINKKGLS